MPTRRRPGEASSPVRRDESLDVERAADGDQLARGASHIEALERITHRATLGEQADERRGAVVRRLASGVLSDGKVTPNGCIQRPRP